MNMSFSCCGISCCGGSHIRSEGKLDARVPQSEIAPIYDKLSGFYNIWGTLTESRARKRAIDLAGIKIMSVIEVQSA